MDITDLLDKTRRYIPEEKLPLIEEAYEFAAHAHQGQVRKSGEPFLEHPLQTAVILADLQLEAVTLAAALLHDVPEDCGVSLEEIERRFGSEVRKLVDGTTKLAKIKWQAPEGEQKSRKNIEDSATQAENLRKMLVAMAEDIRVVLIKLADRLHNMRTLKALLPSKRLHIAQETLEIYVPLAHRLGIWELKWQLEDLSFLYLEPVKYRQIARLIASRLAEREEYIARVIKTLQAELEKAGLEVEVTGRPKHIYSIYQKMEKYAAQGKEFSDIHDLFALRVLGDEVQDCYSALGVIHSLWHPLPGQFNDYIANPKENMYQSLHTTVMGLGATPLEIQIRTHEMHRVAEYGVAAHWRYKEGSKKDIRFEEKLAWLRQVMEWQKELAGAEELLESVKMDIFQDQVFVYTPKGEIKDLPAGSTPLDFAYLIHTDLGHRCIGAKVNGRLVPLSYELQNGEQVEILTSKAPRGPSLDWLNPNLGYVRTSHAREKVRQWFRRQERTENIQQGREILEKEFRRLGVSLGRQGEMARLLKYDSLDDFLAAVGSGSITTHQVAAKLVAEEEQKSVVEPQIIHTTTRPSPGVQVLGVGDLLTNLAQCCNPVPGEEIIGFITRSRGVTIHRKDCHNVTHQVEKERLVKVEWGQGVRLYPVPIGVEAWDRVGLVRDVSAVVSEERVNMVGLHCIEHSDRTVSVFATLETTGIGQLSRLLSKLEGVRGVITVTRRTEGFSREE